eukprot:scaffold4407_cov123-Isochrysis_galbana.AAC.5
MIGPVPRKEGRKEGGALAEQERGGGNYAHPACSMASKYCERPNCSNRRSNCGAQVRGNEVKADEVRAKGLHVGWGGWGGTLGGGIQKGRGDAMDEANRAAAPPNPRQRARRGSRPMPPDFVLRACSK